MFNLLPESLKADIKSEYRVRRFLVIMLFTLCLQIVFVIFLFPSWLISSSKIEDSKGRVAQLEKSKILSNTNTVRPIIRSINTELTSIDKSLEYPTLIPIINNILSKKTLSIKIIQFSYLANSSSTATINIRGVSANREDLVQFKKSLDGLGMFRSVNLPISNYAKDRDIDFGMDIIY